MKFTVINLGCKVNRVESDDVAAALIAQGGRSVSMEQADLVVVNTCTVTGEADKKARKAVRQALRANGYSQVLVTGCASAIDPGEFRDMDARVEVVPKGRLSERIPSDPGARALRMGEGFRTRVSIKVQDGCDHACTFCIVHVARGRATSVSAARVVDEAVAYARAGAKEIVLTGINLGSYASEGVDLAGLLERLLERTAAFDGRGAPPRFRVSSIEPQDVSDNLVDIMARSEGRVCRHLHLPLQSGSSRVLSEMARDYSADWFEALVSRMYERMPMLSLSTDVIVGFPGETEEDFLMTKELVERLAFSRLHVFPYSLREGTPAALSTDQVDEQVKRRRAAQLRRLSAELGRRDYERRVGTVEQVAVEADSALTESYHEIPVPLMAMVGDLVPVVIQPRAEGC